MPAAAKLQSILKCIQNQFAMEQQRAVIDSLDLEGATDAGEALQNQIEEKLMGDGDCDVIHPVSTLWQNRSSWTKTVSFKRLYPAGVGVSLFRALWRRDITGILPGVPAGIFNIGNTCYANSAMQALVVCTPFTGYFVDQFGKLRATVEHRQNHVGNLQETCAWKAKKFPPFLSVELGQALSSLLYLRNQNDSFSPAHLMTAVRRLYPQFSMGSQHDAQEFISCLLDRLHEELKYPVLQLIDEAGEDDDGGTGSTKSDYESCVSLVSDDSASHANREEDSVLNETICHGGEHCADSPVSESAPPVLNGYKYLNGGIHLDGPSYIDGDSAEDASPVSDHSDEFYESAPSDESDFMVNGDGVRHADHHQDSSGEHLPQPAKSVSSSHLHPRCCRVVTWRSVIQDLFYGDFAVSVECKECGEISTRYENFQMLEVSIPSPEQVAELSDNGLGDDVSVSSEPKPVPKPESGFLSRLPKWLTMKSPHVKRRVELMTCLKHEFKPEHLTGENQYRCDRCNMPTDAVKNIRISRLPEILIIHLKRFKYDNSGAFLSSFTNPDRKIHDLVNFPVDDLLDPTLFDMDFTTKYELKSVISHSGSTLSSGHYTSYVKIGPPPSAKWYSCNDADVSEVSSSVIGDTEAYILFYSRFDQEKDEGLELLNSYVQSADLRNFCPDYSEATSPKCLEMFPPTVFSRYDQNVPLVSKEWWSKLKWSNMVHRMSSQDFLCPHRLLLPGVLQRLPDVCIPVSPPVFEKMVDLFDGVNCRLQHRVECALCAQMFHVRPSSNGPIKSVKL